MKTLDDVRPYLLSVEEVRWIPGYDGMYAVTNIGRVFSLKGWHGKPVRILKPGTNSDGYQTVSLRRGPQDISVTGVHRCVALAFIGPPPEPQQEVRHWDGNPQHNEVENLLWGTVKDNAEDSRRHGTLRIGGSVNTSKLTEGDVAEIVRLERQGWTCRALAERFGVSDSEVSYIVTGKSWRHLGLVTAEDEESRRLRLKNRISKLNEEKVREVRRLHASGVSYARIAKQFAVSEAAIRFAVTGKTWSNVKEEA